MEAMGKAYVVVEDGHVVEVGEPLIERCPIFAKARGIQEINQEVIKQNIEFRIRDFGMCTGERAIEMEVFVGFGASEVMMTGLRQGLIDASVSVCEGVGTVITSSPTLTQGIGARISGVIETTLIPKLKNRVEEKGGILLDGNTAIINQPLGVARAIEIGFERVAVTVATLSDAQQCRLIERETGATVVVIGVHVTGMEQDVASDQRECQQQSARTSWNWGAAVRLVAKGKRAAARESQGSHDPDSHQHDETAGPARR